MTDLLTDLVAALRGPAGQVKAKRKELQTKLELAKQHREKLQSAPSSKEDVLRLVSEYIDAEASKYPARLSKTLSSVASRPMADAQQAGKIFGQAGVLVTTLNPNAVGSLADMQLALFYLLRGQIKTGLKAVLDDMEWPADAGPLRSERDKAIAKLDRDITEYEEQLDALDKQRRALLEEI